MKTAALVEIEITPLNPETPQKGFEEVRTKRARSPPLMESESMETAPSNYEKQREERIKANMERMQKLGLSSLSRDVEGAFRTPNTNTNRKRRVHVPSDGSEKKVDLPPLLPPRRSGRLAKVAPVDYAQNSTKTTTPLVEEGRREEFYSEEHEKLLGSCELPWTLFEDGYTKDGVRIYDQVKGKTCHQCRQKTLGYRTKCCKCQLVQGQFCGDCLYMRYGENVLEVIKNPDWLCPVCRGICNCSFCRLKKGWNPTGPLYKKVVRLGYKSVAHYLIQTRRKTVNSAEAPSETAATMSGNTEAANDNQPKPETANDNWPKPETVPDKSDDSIIVVSSDESIADDDGKSTAKRRCVKREKEARGFDNFAPGSIASRLRSRQKKA